MKRALLIDPEKQEVYEVAQSGELVDIARALQCERVDALALPARAWLYVNADAQPKENHPPFWIWGNDRLLRVHGKGLVMGGPDRYGLERPTPITRADVEMLVHFPSPPKSEGA